MIRAAKKANRFGYDGTALELFDEILSDAVDESDDSLAFLEEKFDDSADTYRPLYRQAHAMLVSASMISSAILTLAAVLASDNENSNANAIKDIGETVYESNLRVAEAIDGLASAVSCIDFGD